MQVHPEEEGEGDMSFDIMVCKKYCPYLHGKNPKFSICSLGSKRFFGLKNGYGTQGTCIVTEKFLALTTTDFFIDEWMKQNIDVENELVNCPCKAEHILSLYNEETKKP